jgi:hypothetical protein
VDLTLALEGCHTGVFVDAIRGAELRDTLAALQARLGTASAGAQAPLRALIQVLDNAIAIQGQKDAFTTQARTWWERRYVLEQQMAAAPDDMTRIDAWDRHYITFQDIWNNFVTAITPLLAALQTSATSARITAPRQPRIAAFSGTFDQDSEQAVQAGLDDLDTILNRVLQQVDTRLR